MYLPVCKLVNKRDRKKNPWRNSFIPFSTKTETPFKTWNDFFQFNRHLFSHLRVSDYRKCLFYVRTTKTEQISLRHPFVCPALSDNCWIAVWEPHRVRNKKTCLPVISFSMSRFLCDPPSIPQIDVVSNTLVN